MTKTVRKRMCLLLLLFSCLCGFFLRVFCDSSEEEAVRETEVYLYFQYFMLPVLVTFTSFTFANLCLYPYCFHISLDLPIYYYYLHGDRAMHDDGMIGLAY